MTLSKLLIVVGTTIFVTVIMECNGYSFMQQMIAAISIGAFFGIVDAIDESKN